MFGRVSHDDCLLPGESIEKNQGFCRLARLEKQNSIRIYIPYLTVNPIDFRQEGACFNVNPALFLRDLIGRVDCSEAEINALPVVV